MKFFLRQSVQRQKKGFTLVELLVSISIFVMFLGVVSVSYIGIVRSQRQANEVRKMYSDVRNFVTSLEEDMRLGTIDYDCYSSNLSAKRPTMIAVVGKVLRGLVAHAAPISPVSPIQLPNPQLPSNIQLPPLALVDPCPVDAYSMAEGSYLALVNKDRTQKVVYWFDQEAHQLKVKRFVSQSSADGIDVSAWGAAPGYSYGDNGNIDQNGSRILFSNLVQVKNMKFLVNPPVNPYASKNYAKNKYQFQPKVTLSLTVENASSNLLPFHLDFQTTLSSRVYSRAQE